MEQLKTIKKIIFTAEIAENAEKGQLFSRLRRKKQIQTPWGCPPRWIVLCGLCELCG